mmetsp:Transcript_18427/g.42968  ORF Transcript_18427/g.42968 Transcript_18427/m.42968 type:complete len:282 (+) Transcript_18427:3-848(+)
MMQKQQNSMKEMERENKRVREELADYRKLLEEANTNRSRQDETIEMLSDELTRIRSSHDVSHETFSPRSHERGEPEEELAGASFSGVERYFQQQPRDSTELNEYKEIKKEILLNKHVYGGILDADNLLKFDSADTFSEMTSELKDKEDESTYDTSTNSTSNGDDYPEVTERRENDLRQEDSDPPPIVDHDTLFDPNFGQDDHHHHHLHNRHHGATLEFSGSSGGTSLRGMDSDIISLSSAARSKEEVNLFKSRLQEIQRKRQMRKMREGAYGSKSGQVRFD